MRRKCLSYLCGRGRVWLVEHGPDLGLGLLPPGEVAGVVVLLEAELLGRLLLAGLLHVEVQPVQDGEGLLGITMLRGEERTAN